MTRRSCGVAVAALAALALAAPAAHAAKSPLNAYRVAPTAENKQRLSLEGFDLTEGDRGRYIEIYATKGQAKALRADGVEADRVTNFQDAADPEDYTGSDAAWDVWTRYDAVAGDGKEQYVEQYDRLAEKPFVKKEIIGETHLGREMFALKITKDADWRPTTPKPAVLYNAQQHAREWLAGETCRRTAEFLVDNYGRTGAARDSAGNPIDGLTAEEVTELVDTRELWFVCISNPDGYEYTFTPDNRLWRKNMADNDGNGILGESRTASTPTATTPTNWGRDAEGASDDPTDETYRGTGPDSEPETKAMKSLWDRVDFVFQKNDHTAAELLLYPTGFQQYTPTPDNGVVRGARGQRRRLGDRRQGVGRGLRDVGDHRQPARRGHLAQPVRPGPRRRALHHQRRPGRRRLRTHGILPFTPEGSEPAADNVSGFEFQDDEEDIEAEFQRHLLFSLDLARSAARPGESGRRTSATRSRTSTWTTSPCPTAIRSPSR